MNNILDGLLVGLALVMSAAYAAAALGPRAWRHRAAAALAGFAARLPKAYGLRRIAQRYAHSGAAQAPGACGGCDDCGSPTSAAPHADGDVRIPLARIGRRER
jgi:hypothetical protein